MGGELTDCKVQELIDSKLLVINDGYRAKNSELNDSIGFPFARAGNINNGFNFRDADRLHFDMQNCLGIKVSQPGDVVFTSKGTVGRFAYVKDTTEIFVYSPQLCFWRSADQNLLNSRYLYYWMHGPEFTSQIYGLKGQTDMADYVSLRDQRNMRISIPPINMQLPVVLVLGTLDDKIELNRRTNETLEAMAQALFKSWFVDFDPVIDNALAAGVSASVNPLIYAAACCFANL